MDECGDGVGQDRRADQRGADVCGAGEEFGAGVGVYLAFVVWDGGCAVSVPSLELRVE